MHLVEEPVRGRAVAGSGADLLSIVLTVSAASAPTRTARHQVVDQVRSLRRWLGHAGLDSVQAEILVIDGGALGMSDIAPLQALSARAVPFPRHSASGRAALRNYGLARAAHPLVLFVDAEVELGDALLPALLAVARDPEVGAVGPWLVPSAARADRPLQEQAVSALCGGCLLVRRDQARRLRGFNAAIRPDLACDVDFCLRLRAAGDRIVCTPHGLPTHGAARIRIEDPKVMATLSGIWNGLTPQAIDENRVLTDTPSELPVMELPKLLHPVPTAVLLPDPAPGPPTDAPAAPADPTMRLKTAIPADEFDLRDILLGLMQPAQVVPPILPPVLAAVPPRAVPSEPQPGPVIEAVPRPQPPPVPGAPSRPPATTAPVAAWSRSKPAPTTPPAPPGPAPGRRSSWRRTE